uniref:Dolichyl-diphosphooligosaccharide--protein glycosyltransferase subunit OST2 n=1 Tax=Hemiselmis andersenii TaxID=464988 RepID=A0A6U4MZF2_HEMAN|mmetsp:Transcript_1559/g.3745  ORF Transcript_1559/g.3745 Transcript_1559/m.3745 type:complete len:119 (+) Transcript_1559:114-470(+)
MGDDLAGLSRVVWGSYVANTPHNLKVIDCFLAYFAMMAAVQTVYCLVGGGYPFNSYLAGMMSCVGMFVATASLRVQINPANKADLTAGGGSVPSKGRAFLDWLLCCLLIHLGVFCFMG